MLKSDSRFPEAAESIALAPVWIWLLIIEYSPRYIATQCTDFRTPLEHNDSRKQLAQRIQNVRHIVPVRTRNGIIIDTLVVTEWSGNLHFESGTEAADYVGRIFDGQPFMALWK
jgi:hypothetical protein